jgi:hypothetical protein
MLRAGDAARARGETTPSNIVGDIDECPCCLERYGKAGSMSPSGRERVRNGMYCLAGAFCISVFVDDNDHPGWLCAGGQGVALQARRLPGLYKELEPRRGEKSEQRDRRCLLL